MQKTVLSCDLCKMEINPDGEYIDASNRKPGMHFHEDCFEAPLNLKDVLELIGVRDLVFRNGPARLLYTSMRGEYSSTGVSSYAGVQALAPPYRPPYGHASR